MCGVNLFVVSVVVSLLWRYVLREGPVRPDADESDVRMLTKRLTPGLAGYVAVIVAGLFLPVVAVFGYRAITVYVAQRPGPDVGAEAAVGGLRCGAAAG